MYHFFSKNETRKNERVTFVGNFTDGVLKIAVARCSKKDQFIRRKGVQIAEGRLSKNKLVFSQEMPNCTGAEFVEISKSLVGEIVRTKVVLMANKPAIIPVN